MDLEQNFALPKGINVTGSDYLAPKKYSPTFCPAFIRYSCSLPLFLENFPYLPILLWSMLSLFPDQHKRFVPQWKAPLSSEHSPQVKSEPFTSPLNSSGCPLRFIDRNLSYTAHWLLQQSSAVSSPVPSKIPTCAPQEILAAHGSGCSKYFVVGMLSGSLNVDNSAVNTYPGRNEPHQTL